jgi:aspartate oxidase
LPVRLLLYVSLEIPIDKSPSSLGARRHESNTRYAQGGIIGRGPDDTSELFFEDIVAAGAG